MTGLVSAASGASADVARLVAAAQEVLDAHGRPRMALWSTHYESDEISCSCGYVSMADDYEKARANLRAHLLRSEKKASAEAERPWKELASALAGMEDS